METLRMNRSRQRKNARAPRNHPPILARSSPASCSPSLEGRPLSFLFPFPLGKGLGVRLPDVSTSRLIPPTLRIKLGLW
jgi:hypothetical protein